MLSMYLLLTGEFTSGTTVSNTGASSLPKSRIEVMRSRIRRLPLNVNGFPLGPDPYLVTTFTPYPRTPTGAWTPSGSRRPGVLFSTPTMRYGFKSLSAIIRREVL